MRVSLLRRLHDALARGDALCVQIKAPADTSEKIDIYGQICIQVTTVQVFRLLCGYDPVGKFSLDLTFDSNWQRTDSEG